jgi:hypothetical protein
MLVSYLNNCFLKGKYKIDCQVKNNFTMGKVSYIF